MLTGVNLLLRLAGTGFQVFLSRRIGAAGIGLLQLVMSVGNLALVAGIAGIRTAAMYLTAEELGKKQPDAVGNVLSGCFLYSICFSGCIGLGLYLSAPYLAEYWVGNKETIPALRLLGGFLPIVCLGGVMSGYFTAAKRIGTLAAVEVAEQLCSMVCTVFLLVFWAGKDAHRACISVIMGSSMGACVTLGSLLILYPERKHRYRSAPIHRRLLGTALPLAAADVIRSGIGTTENLMVPKRLHLFAGEADPLGAFGRISGMVFPVMMFPACILYALAELLIPELAGCRAAKNHERIEYLVRRGLWAALVYGCFFGGLIFLLAPQLCTILYHSPEAGVWLQRYAVMVPFLYCDAITDAMTKGLGQQKTCVRYNILTSAMDVLFLYLLLPSYGMQGYYLSFLVTHLLNFLLSLRRLMKISRYRIPAYLPMLAGASVMLSALAASWVGVLWYPLLAAVTFRLTGVLGQEDLQWLRQLIRIRMPKKKDSSRKLVERIL